MRDFDLGRRFALVMIPYRAFLHLLTVEDQKRALQCMRAHLTDGGRLILNLFDPRLSLLVAHDETLRRFQEFTDPATGRRTVVWAARRYDQEQQVLAEERILDVLDEEERVLSRSYERFSLRAIFRYEMQHLLELCGFTIEALYGDFSRGPFRAGGEQIWIARAG